MGMFDYIKSEVLLPDNEPISGVLFQTKSLENVMYTYVITAKGELYQEHWDYKWIENDNHFFKGYAEKIEDSYRRIYLTDYHGDVIFYTGLNANKVFRNYYARFTDGKLTKLWYTDTQY